MFLLGIFLTANKVHMIPQSHHNFIDLMVNLSTAVILSSTDDEAAQ
mgnify:CR=1 FL=1